MAPAVHSAEPRIAYADAGGVIAVVGPLMIMDWRGQVDARHLAAIRAEHFALLRRYPEGTVGIHLTGDTVRLPGGSDRTATFELGRQTASSTRAVGVLIAAEGFIASALQSFAIGLFATFGRAKAKSFRELPPLCQWLAGEVPVLGSPDEIARAVAAVRAHQPDRAQLQ